MEEKEILEEVLEEEKEHVLHEGVSTEKPAEKIEEVQQAEKSETQKALEIMLGLDTEPALLMAVNEEERSSSPLLSKAREFRALFEQLEAKKGE